MPGASDQTKRVKIVNANWTPSPDGGDGKFELMLVTDDDQRHILGASPASIAAVLALAKLDAVLAWDPAAPTLIAANVVGEMPWTKQA
jgi:hypothetical protein